MEERKNPTALCICIILGALVCYGLGLGPACWLSSRFGGTKVVTLAYRPVTFAVEVIGIDRLMEAIQWWSAVGANDSHQWSFSADEPGHAEWASLFDIALERLIIGEDDGMSTISPFGRSLKPLTPDEPSESPSSP